MMKTIIVQNLSRRFKSSMLSASLIKLLSAVIISFLVGTKCTAQFNIKVGYSGAYTSPDNYNSIISRINLLYDGVQQPFPELNLMNGLDLGFRYRFGNSALEISWHQMAANANAIGQDLNENTIDDYLQASIRAYSIGIENFLGNAGFGASIGSRRFKIQQAISGFDANEELGKDSGLFSRFYLFYQFKSNNVSLVFKPFIEVGWDELSNSGLEANYFDPEALGTTDKFTMFGISLLFYNGRQK